MKSLMEDTKKVLLLCAGEVARSKEELEQIDSTTGDGDLGISMMKAADALKSAVESFQEADIGKLFTKCAFAVNGAAPSTMGTLICSGLLRLGREFSGKTFLAENDIFRIPGLFADAIMARGNAKEGDRTVLDALLPMSRAYEKVSRNGGSIKDALSAGKEAADAGAEKTKTLKPMVGRAKWNQENSIGIVDGGAKICSIVANCLLADQQISSISSTEVIG